jgi:hypothetical protein
VLDSWLEKGYRRMIPRKPRMLRYNNFLLAVITISKPFAFNPFLPEEAQEEI